MDQNSQVNNKIYDKYGERWYTAQDDPVALLRAEHRLQFPWILDRIKEQDLGRADGLDIGCGAGFLSNELAKCGLRVTGIDLSAESLRVAHAHDETQSVDYLMADAYDLPFDDESFEFVTAMDFLEHVEDPQRVIQEVSRVLKPQGLFFFHTFNRNVLSWLIVIKSVEWLVKNTPKNMHVLPYFIRPGELKEFCRHAGMEVLEMTGVKPVLSTITWEMIRTGTVSDELKFETTKSRLLSYMGVAKKRFH